jgi:hypothetical protein
MNVKAALSSHKRPSLAWDNEISASAALLHPVLVKGRIMSTDALHRQKKWCAGVHAYAG